jgi:hypothetical protein
MTSLRRIGFFSGGFPTPVEVFPTSVGGFDPVPCLASSLLKIGTHKIRMEKQHHKLMTVLRHCVDDLVLMCWWVDVLTCWWLCCCIDDCVGDLCKLVCKLVCKLTCWRSRLIASACRGIRTVECGTGCQDLAVNSRQPIQHTRAAKQQHNATHQHGVINLSR